MSPGPVPVRPPMSPAAMLRMSIIERLIDEVEPNSILEIGAGMGAAAWHLSEGREYLGYEPDPVAFATAKQRLVGRPNAQLIQSVLPHEPERTFDLVAAFEVLEHIEDDAEALRTWTEWTAPGGHLILSVPAKEDRFGPMDDHVGHYRRYERNDLVRLMEDSGLVQTRVRSYGMPLGYLLESVRNRLLSRRLADVEDMSDRTGRSGRSFQPDGSGNLLRVATYPFVMMQRPFENSEWGIGWVAIGRRPG